VFAKNIGIKMSSLNYSYKKGLCQQKRSRHWTRKANNTRVVYRNIKPTEESA